MTENRKRVLIIGLDGFTWRVGKKMEREGYMPTLGRLMKSGCHGILKSIVSYETGPAWSSFQTGCLPKQTGIFAFHSYEHAQRQIKLNSFQQIGRPTVWELLSAEGKKVVSINMPMTSPPPTVNGVIIPGLTCPEISRETVFPPEIFDRYIEPNSDYRVVDNSEKPDLESYIASAIKTEKIHCDLAVQLMRDMDWDLFSIQIQSTDAFQHPNWWALDADAEGFEEGAFLQAAEFYRSIDTVIEKLMDAAGESVLTVIASDHGFCSKDTEIGINTWLVENGYLKLKGLVPEKEKTFKQSLKQRFPVVKFLAGVYGKIGRWMFPSMHKKEDSGMHSENVVRHIRETIDLDHTSAFCLGGMAGSLYITDRSQVEQTEKMIQKLLEEFGPDSQNPLIEKIQPIEKCCEETEILDFFPDYIISFLPGVEARINPAISPVVRSGIIDGKQTGTHEPDGVFVLHGPEVKGLDFNADIVDIAPTLLSYLSVPVPDYMDGKVLTQAFSQPLNVQYKSVEITEKKSAEYSDTDQSMVEKQLKDLGYL